MNNASITMQEVLSEEIVKDPSPQLRNRATQLTDIIDALQHIGGSNYWLVLQKYVFEVELDKAKRSLATSKDTTEMFRLQGELRALERFDLEAALTKYRNELKAIRKNIND